MAEVSEVRVKKKVLIQLGLPFFLLVSFVITVIIFGTLYFTAQLKGESNPHDAKQVSVDTTELVEEYLAAQRAVVQNLMIESGDETQVRQILSQNKSLLAFGVFESDGTQIAEYHKGRTSDELLAVTLSVSKNIQTLSGSSESIQLRSIDGDTYMVWLARVSENDQYLFASFSIDPITSSFDQQTILSPLHISIANKNTGQPLFGRNTLPRELEESRPPDTSLQALLENNKRSYGFVTEDGKRVDGHYEAIAGTPWILIAETEATAASGFSVKTFVAAAIVLVIFVLLLFYYIAVFNQKVILPLKNIEKALHYYKTGDYSEPIKVDTQNEFVAIADQLNNMARHIEGNTSERVSELKHALDRQNTDTRLLIEKDVELREQGVKLKELDQAKSMFVSVAAHQMRTPLAAVKWALKLVMDGDVGPVNAEQTEYLGKGYESTTRMIDLINDLLDVDKIESDKFSYVLKEEKLEAIVQGIIDDLTPISKEKGVNLIYQKDSDAFPAIAADQIKLRNALQNLIDNAIKYTIGGGDVTVEMSTDNTMMFMKVTDTGIGIPKSEQGKVFGKFFRAKNAVRQETDGSGLGLFIVRKIIEKHGGNIRFESTENVGTTFYIEIPTLGNGPALGSVDDAGKTETSTENPEETREETKETTDTKEIKETKNEATS